MSIPLTGPESLFVRLGHIFKTFNIVNEQRGTTLPPRIDQIEADFQSSNQDIVDNIYTSLLSHQNANGVLPSYLSVLVQNILTRMANDDSPQTSLTSVPVAMRTLIDQMNDASETVKSCAVSGSVTADSGNNGNANIAVSVKDANGIVQENSFAEKFRCTVISDSQTRGVTEGREQIVCIGEYAIGDQFSWLYPQGSGASPQITCVDASQSQGSGTRNNLNNSNFELWTTPNIPDSWHIGTGTAGTTVKRSTTNFYDGASSLEFVGDGSELTSIYQQFATTLASGDTSIVMPAITQFAVNAWIKVDVVPAGGVLRFALIDDSGNVMADEQGNASSFMVDLATAGTTFAPVSGFLRTPRVLPAYTRLQIKLTTALSSGSSVFIDRLAMAQPSVAYQGGPSFAAFSGSEKLINGDYFEINISNDYGGLFQRLFDRFFNMKSMNLLLPSSNSPTITDSLIS